jgi:hypothetical protein
MLLTLNNLPFIQLDDYLDIEKMLSLKNEWEFLLASQWDNIRTGVWNAGGHAPEDYYNSPAIHREKGLLYYVYRQANIDRQTDVDLEKHLRHFENKKDLHGMSRYLKLRYKAFDPYNVLNVRKTTGPYYAADAYKFTDEDWAKYHWEDYFVNNFPNLHEYVCNLPFDRIGVVTVFFNEHFIPQGYHRDLNYFPYEKGNSPNTFPHRQELIWFRFEKDRPFYILDVDIGEGKVLEKHSVTGYSAFFNHHNWHGSFDYYPNSSVTVKVEGKFTDDFRKKIGLDHLEYYYKNN